MATLEVRTFEEDDVGAAAGLLERRHREHLASEPLLAHAVDYEALLRGERTDATGAVAVVGTTVVGYLLGRHGSGPLGPHVWSTSAGHATDEPGVVADLYATAAARWVDEGLTRHFVFAPATRTRVEPWFRLGFGASAFQAVREIDATPVVAPTATITIRRGTPSDLAAAAALDRELALHQAASPSFSDLEVGTTASYVDEWRDTWTNDVYVHFVAEVDSEVAGHLLLYRRPTGDLRVPEHSIDLAHATTTPVRRGAGVGRALFAASHDWAREHAMTSMTTDWRATNLLAARFWPHRGFRPTYVRLYRSIP